MNYRDAAQLIITILLGSFLCVNACSYMRNARAEPAEPLGGWETFPGPVSEPTSTKGE